MQGEGVHKDNLIEEMLRNIPDPAMREQYGRMVSGEIMAQVICVSEDEYGMVEQAVLDEDNQPVLYKSGKRKGEPKTEKVKTLVRKGCKGRTIATISKDGRVVETAPVEDPASPNGVYSSGLEGSRIRLDGTLGFRCYCGNNSILLEEEQGIIGPTPPSEADLQTIALRLSKRTNIIMPADVKAKKEGFAIIEVGA